MEKGLEPGLIMLPATDIHTHRAHQHQYSQTDNNCIDQPCTEQRLKTRRSAVPPTPLAGDLAR